jgi:hypothetical protein
LVLCDQFRLERGLSTTRNIQFELTTRRQHGFGTAPVAVVAGLALSVFRIQMRRQVVIALPAIVFMFTALAISSEYLKHADIAPTICALIERPTLKSERPNRELSRGPRLPVGGSVRLDEVAVRGSARPMHVPFA